MFFYNVKARLSLFCCVFLGTLGLIDVSVVRGQINDWSEYASAVVAHFSQVSGDVTSLRYTYFYYLKKEDVKAINQTTDDPVARKMFGMLYRTQSTVPDNLTDADLAYLGSDISRLKKRAASVIGSVSDTQIRNLENFSPTQIQNLLNGVATSLYEVLPKPSGAFTTTWASESLHAAYKDIRLATLRKRSVLVRLLESEHLITIPTNSSLYFTWSGTPDIPIDLQAPLWRKSDVSKLEKLFSSVTYSNLAVKRIDMILKSE